jgi:hypothetical protein
MDGLASLFMLFVAAIVGLLTYIVVPFTPITVLMIVAGAGLVGGLWWHWTQFSVDYRTSTWQEQLRNYAAYVMVGVVIAVSYTFYVFGWGGVSGYVTSAAESIRSATVGAVSEVAGNIGGAASATGSALFGSSNMNRGRNTGGGNLNLNLGRNRGSGNLALE